MKETAATEIDTLSQADALPIWNPAPERALRNIRGRARDFSQARPELGHATNAAAFIGRRSMSQGAFFDRRVFLISYDRSEEHTSELQSP